MRRKEDIARLIAELEADYETLMDLVHKNRLMTQKIERSEPDEFDWAALGYTLHNVYTAFENYFLRVAKFFENALDTTEWHRSLLSRMTLTIESVRPSVISKELFCDLDDLRGFRHVFRYMYQYQLDPAKMQLVNAKIPRIAARFKDAHQAFMNYLAQLGENI